MVCGMSYQVKLELFEGPMDLLLHLIRRDKINIYDIPISHITHEYLAYIEMMQELELEIAGDFFVMAATLMRIKAQMLLPRRELAEEEEDPRDELVKNLIEYRKYKKAADHLAEKEENRRKVFIRPAPRDIEEKEAAPKIELSIFDLMDAFKKILTDLKQQVTYTVQLESFTVEEKIDFIKGTLADRSEILFTELFSGSPCRTEVITTFMALLELVKSGVLVASPMSSSGDIWLYRRKNETISETGSYE